MSNKAKGKVSQGYMIFSDSVMSKDKYHVTTRGKLFKTKAAAQKFIKENKMTHVKIMKW